MNSYELSRIWFDFAFENQGEVSPSDSALYFWLIEKFNRCGWVKNLSITSTENMAACGFKTYPPYKKSLDNLVNWGFIEIIKQSKNQYQTTVIGLSKNNKALDKALDKALLNQTTKHVSSNQESTFDINKTSNNKPQTLKPQTIEDRKLKFADTLKPFENIYEKNLLKEFYEYWTEPTKSGNQFRMELQKTWGLERRLKTWANNDKSFKKPQINGPFPKISFNDKPQSKMQPYYDRMQSIESSVSQYLKDNPE